MVNSNTEDHSVLVKRGKWSMPGVPHSGWVCVDIEDLGEPQVECEMCESKTIRYVHRMEHPFYAKVLAVGCVCAGNMEGDLAAAKNRDATMQSRATKRKRWTTRKWKISQNGNPTIKAYGFRVTVYQRGGGWAATLSRLSGVDVLPGRRIVHGKRNYAAIQQAKLAAFDLITLILSGKVAASNG